jgi:hypothetical protein
MRAHSMLRTATHTIAARYQATPRLLFRMVRTSAMCKPHRNRIILPLFWLASNKFSMKMRAHWHTTNPLESLLRHLQA